MTPVLCLNCGKARSEHGFSLIPNWCHENQADDLAKMKWRSPVDETAIEQRVVEKIATWLERVADDHFLAEELRSGAWKEKP